MSEERQPEQRPEREAAGTPEQTKELLPRIYVASLADYNAGRLHGCWMDAARPATELQEDIGIMLALSNEPVAEEWAIHDFAGFRGAKIDEFEDLEVVSKLATGVAEVGSAYAAWASIAGKDVDSLNRFEDAYLGTWESVEEYAKELVGSFGLDEELKRIPEWLQRYVMFDIRGFARDLQLGGDITAIEDRRERRVHIFDGRA